jgi:hypothetical protein
MNKSQKLLLETGHRTVRFGKPGGMVSLAPTAVKGTVGSNEDVLFLAKWHQTRERDKIHDNSRSCGGG